MKKVLFVSLALAGVSVLSVAHATIITENFTTNPLQNGWQIFGNTNLFQWNSTNQNLDVTWDSSQTNSYFYHPLGTVVTRNDDFSVAFDLRLNDIGPGPDGDFPFELAVGFLNLDEATQTNFLRGTGYSSPDLVEFDYFWDSGYGATVWPGIVDTNSSFNYNGANDYAIFALTPADWYHVVMTYTASNQTLVTALVNSEQTSGVTIIEPLDDHFTDFRVDAISMISYNDTDAYDGSILAHGVVANIAVTFPPPPIQYLTGSFSNAVWRAQFLSQSNWIYTLQHTTNLIAWNDISASGGNGTNLFLQDTNAPVDKAFYRVRAERPQ
jgi:hypothetical protein